MSTVLMVWILLLTSSLSNCTERCSSRYILKILLLKIQSNSLILYLNLKWANLHFAFAPSLSYTLIYLIVKNGMAYLPKYALKTVKLIGLCTSGVWIITFKGLIWYCYTKWAYLLLCLADRSFNSNKLVRQSPNLTLYDCYR